MCDLPPLLASTVVVALLALGASMLAGVVLAAALAVGRIVWRLAARYW
jgi:hypothetical protein